MWRVLSGRAAQYLRGQLNKCFMNEIEGRFLIIESYIRALRKNVTLLALIATLRSLLIFLFWHCGQLSSQSFCTRTLAGQGVIDHLFDFFPREFGDVREFSDDQMARARHSLLLFWRERLAFTQFGHSFERIGDFIDFTRSHTFGVLGVSFPMIARDFNVFAQKAQ